MQQTRSQRLNDPRLIAVLAELAAVAAGDSRVIADARSTAARLDRPPSVWEMGELCAAAALPVGPELGQLLYLLVRIMRPTRVVEFGTSFGASLLQLAAGVHDNGAGHVIGSETNRAKIDRANANLELTGLSSVAHILEGDARETLAQVQGPVDLVLLDGWKEMYLPVLEVLEPRMRPGTLVVADNLSMLPRAYLDRVRSPQGDYVSISLPLGDGVELSLRQTEYLPQTTAGL